MDFIRGSGGNITLFIFCMLRFSTPSGKQKGKNAEVVGKFTCHGYNTFGPFKLVGGTSKGHPDENDLIDAVEFFRGLIRVGRAE